MKSKHLSELWLIQNDDLDFSAQHEDVVEQVEEEEASAGRQNDFKLEQKLFFATTSQKLFGGSLAQK